MTSDKYASNRPDDDDEDDFGLSPEDNVVLSSDLVDHYEGTEHDSAPSALPDDNFQMPADASDDLASEATSNHERDLVKETGLAPEPSKPKAGGLKKMFSNPDTPSIDPVAALRAEHGDTKQTFQREGINGPITESKSDGASSGRGLNIMAAGSMVAMLVLLVFFGFTSFQLTGRVNQMDATLLAVGKRMVELNNSLDQLETLNQTLRGTVQGQAESGGVVSQNVSSVQLDQAVTEQLREQSAQLRDILDALAAIPTQRAGFDPQTEQEIKSLTRDLSALLELEKANYLEALRAQAKTSDEQQQTEELVSYPPSN
jgi:hypothetical protein